MEPLVTPGAPNKPFADFSTLRRLLKHWWVGTGKRKPLSYGFIRS
jgi:hypothetical protein